MADIPSNGTTKHLPCPAFDEHGRLLDDIGDYLLGLDRKVSQITELARPVQSIAATLKEMQKDNHIMLDAMLSQRGAGSYIMIGLVAVVGLALIFEIVANRGTTFAATTPYGSVNVGQPEHHTETAHGK